MLLPTVTKSTEFQLSDLVAKNDIEKVNEFIKSNLDFVREGRNFLITYVFFLTSSKPENKGRSKPNQKLAIPTESLSLLHVAAYYDHFELFILLEAIGIPLNALSAASYYPLHYACAGRALECAAYIIEKDPDQVRVEKLDIQYPPIYLATYADSPELLEMLFNHGDDLSKKKNQDSHPFQQALRNRHYNCLLVLLEHKCRTDVTTGQTPLMFAIINDLAEAVPILLSLGQDPHKVTPRGETALSFACMFQDAKSVKLLCDCMDDIEIPRNDLDRNPSIARFAVLSKNIEILEFILKKGCDLHRTDNRGELPADSVLGFYEDEQAVEVLSLLIKYGFDINYKENGDSLTFLERVLRLSVKKYPKLVEFLLSQGADPKMMKLDGTCLLDQVRKYKRSKMMVQKIYFEIFSKFYPEINE